MQPPSASLWKTSILEISLSFATYALLQQCYAWHPHGNIHTADDLTFILDPNIAFTSTHKTTNHCWSSPMTEHIPIFTMSCNIMKTSNGPITSLSMMGIKPTPLILQCSYVTHWTHKWQEHCENSPTNLMRIHSHLSPTNLIRIHSHLIKNIVATSFLFSLEQPIYWQIFRRLNHTRYQGAILIFQIIRKT